MTDMGVPYNLDEATKGMAEGAIASGASRRALYRPPGASRAFGPLQPPRLRLGLVSAAERGSAATISRGSLFMMPVFSVQASSRPDAPNDRDGAPRPLLLASHVKNVRRRPQGPGRRPRPRPQGRPRSTEGQRVRHDR